MHAPQPGSDDGTYLPQFRFSFLAPRHWGTWSALALVRVLAWMPWPIRAAVGVGLGDVARWFSRKRREIARVNLRLCYPERSDAERERMLRDHFRCRMRAAVDYGILWWGSARRLRRLVAVEGERHFRKHHAKGRPVILLTGHSLMLDFGAAVLTTRYPGVGLVKPARNPVADWFLQRARQRFNARLCTRGQGFRPVIRALRGGAFFYYLPDEDLGARDSVFAPFFGVPAATLATLGRLAQLADAVVIPAYTRYLPGTGRYEQHLFPALKDFPSGDAQRDAERMNRELEKLIALAPEQYMWTMRRFRTRPDGGQNAYDAAGV